MDLSCQLSDLFNLSTLSYPLQPPLAEEVLQLSSTEISEIQIVEGILNGNKHCEELLFRRYSKGLVIMLTSRSGDFSLAEDLAQDTLVVVLNRLRRAGIENPAKLSTFVYQTAKFILIGFRRRHRNKMELKVEHLVEGIDTISPELNVLRESTVEETRQLISELKIERDRELLMRYYLYEHPKPQICEELNLSTEHFDRVIHRAKQRLRELVTGKEVH